MACLKGLQVIGEVDILVLYTQLLPYAGAETLYCLGGDIQYSSDLFGGEATLDQITDPHLSYGQFELKIR